MRYQFNDAGRKRPSLDCVARAISITLEMPYRKVCQLLNDEALRLGMPCDPFEGVRLKTYEAFLSSRGWVYSPVFIVRRSVTRARVSVSEGILRHGRFVVRTPGHLVSVVNGVVHDTFDSRGRAALGFFYKPSSVFSDCVSHPGFRNSKISLDIHARHIHNSTRKAFPRFERAATRNSNIKG